MLYNLRKQIVVFCLVLSFFSVLSCSSENDSLQKQYGTDSLYFLGLKALEENDIKNAERFFNESIKKGGRYSSRRSAEELTRIGNMQQRLAAGEFLAKKFPDDESLLLYANELSEDKEYTRLIQLTDKINLEASSNALIKLRLDALLQKNDFRYEETLYNWCVLRPFTSEHYKTIKNFSEVSNNLSYKIIENFRTLVYLQDYQAAFAQISVIISTIKSDNSLHFENQIVSDLGKACLYGSSSWVENAQFFENLADELIAENNKSAAFYAWFYAARLYEKGGNYYTLATRRYINAMEFAQSDEQYDNALWYLLNLDLGISTDRAIETLRAYCSKWHDSLYFENFFDNLSVLLLSGQKWNDFYKVYTIIKGYVDDSILAKYAYLSGRLIEEGLANPITNLKTEDESKKLFLDALHSGSSFYYKVLAMERLNLSDLQIKKIMLYPSVSSEKNIDYEAEKLLLGYADFGFPQRIYSEWRRFEENGTQLSTLCLISVSSFIQKCGNQIPDGMYKSLRIASLAVNRSNEELTKESLSLAYPQYYRDFISESCQEFSVDEDVMYALVRSESFFNAGVKSYAGAIGLAQLMEATGADIAKRLKVENFDLTDAQTSIRFGSYYLNNMTQRLDSVMLGVFAYNSGITRVRRWISNSQKELGSPKILPLDLFLETIPFAETREYGRKIISAASVYGWLYSDKSPVETVRKFIK